MITQAQAIAAVDRFDGLLYFDRVSPAVRLEIAEVLAGLVNMPENDPRESNLRFRGVPYVTPAQRLQKFVRLILTKGPGTWMGIPQLIALYSTQFIAAERDLVVDCSTCNVAGFTEEDYVAKSLAPPAEPLYLPQPGDEPIGSEIFSQMKQLEAARVTKGGRDD